MKFQCEMLVISLSCSPSFSVCFSLVSDVTCDLILTTKVVRKVTSCAKCVAIQQIQFSYT